MISNCFNKAFIPSSFFNVTKNDGLQQKKTAQNCLCGKLMHLWEYTAPHAVRSRGGKARSPVRHIAPDSAKRAKSGRFGHTHKTAPQEKRKRHREGQEKSGQHCCPPAFSSRSLADQFDFFGHRSFFAHARVQAHTLSGFQGGNPGTIQ